MPVCANQCQYLYFQVKPVLALHRLSVFGERLALTCQCDTSSLHQRANRTRLAIEPASHPLCGSIYLLLLSSIVHSAMALTHPIRAAHLHSVQRQIAHFSKPSLAINQIRADRYSASSKFGLCDQINTKLNWIDKFEL